MVVLNKALHDKVVFKYTDSAGQEKVVKLGGLDGRPLTVPDGRAPSSLALSSHARAAFFHATQRKWCRKADVPPLVACDGALLERYLRDSVSASSSGNCGSGGSGSGGSRSSSAGAEEEEEAGVQVGAAEEVGALGPEEEDVEEGYSRGATSYASATRCDEIYNTCSDPDSGLAGKRLQQLEL